MSELCTADGHVMNGKLNIIETKFGPNVSDKQITPKTIITTGGRSMV